MLLAARARLLDRIEEGGPAALAHAGLVSLAPLVLWALAICTDVTTARAYRSELALVALGLFALGSVPLLARVARTLDDAFDRRIRYLGREITWTRRGLAAIGWVLIVALGALALFGPIAARRLGLDVVLPPAVEGAAEIAVFVSLWGAVALLEGSLATFVWRGSDLAWCALAAALPLYAVLLGTRLAILASGDRPLIVGAVYAGALVAAPIVVAYAFVAAAAWVAEHRAQRSEAFDEERALDELRAPAE